MEYETLATEMLHELKASNKRLWISLIVVIILWFSTIIGFVLFINQYEVGTYEDELYMTTDGYGDNNDNSINVEGDLINGNHKDAQ